MDILFRICGIALLALLCSVLLKSSNPSSSLFIIVAACVAMVWIIFPSAQALAAYCSRIAESAGLELGILTPLLKTLGVCLTAKITAELCRDAGERAMAVKVELAGVVSGLICALPLISETLRMIGEL